MSFSDDPKLPQDVVVEILKRLPVASLLRFRCVSRSWRSAIDDPRFVALHMDHSALDASKWHTLCLDWRDPLQKAFSLSSDESQLQLPFVTPTNCYCFVGSCNGLICVTELSSGYGRTMYLWNPSTRHYKVVRRSGLKHQFLSVETARLVVGFGFDARSHDYYIVRILYFPDDNHPGIGGTEPRVEIYSLRTDSWRGVQCEVPAIHHHHDKAVFLNGNLHWFAFKYDDMWEVPGSGSIVLFDIAGEVFDEMAPPEEVSQEDNGGVTVSVAVLNDLLAVFISLAKEVVGPKPHSVCSVWVMREYGVPESWTKLYAFKACGVVTRFDGFARNGTLLMEIFPGKRVSWNPISGQYAELPLSTTCNLVTVVESLVHFSDDSIATTVASNAD